MSSGFMGPFFTSARNDLLATGNFGPAGVVPRPLQLTAVPTLDLPTTLMNADVVLLTAVLSRLDEDERMLLNSFVLAGGGAFMFENGVASGLEDFLGVTPGAGALGSRAVVSNPSSPIVNGPFGVLVQGTQLKHQAAGSFADVGRHGNTALTTGTEGFAVAFTLGAGRMGPRSPTRRSSCR